MNKLTGIIILSLSALLLFTGCTTDVEDTAGTDYLLAGYYMIAGEETPLTDDDGGNSRATAPAYWDNYSNYTYAELIALGTDGLKINNYPERGQKTYVTVEATDVADVYKVTSRTEYPKKEEIFDYYLEEYYLTPASWSAGELWSEGVVCTADGTEDETYRETMEVHFQDGSVRYEWIADVHPDAGGTAEYAMFDIDGDMSFPSEFTGPAAGDSSWSSKVYYYQKVEAWISWFYKENKETFGVRYYTSAADSGDNGWPSSTLAYEHTVTRQVSGWGDSDWGDLLDWLFGDGSGDSSGSSTGETLAETVIREEISSNGKKTTVSSTTIVPTFGDTFTIDKSMEYVLE
ncbi:MAG: hypothetical protein PQJ58_02320 [Spirochaetales bacterium]|nr:hypothetical protein [Spirochaetales bacterium]